MKLRYKLPLYYGIVGLICIILFWLLSYYSKNLVQWFIQHRFDESARNIQDNIDSFLDERVKDLNTISKHWTLNTFLREEEKKSAQIELDNFLVINNSFNYLEVFDLEWNIILRSDIVRRWETNKFYLIKNESSKRIWTKVNNYLKFKGIIHISDIIINDFTEKSINIFIRNNNLILKWNLKLDFIDELVNDSSVWKKALFEIKNKNKKNIYIIENAIISDTDKNIFKWISYSRHNSWRIDIEQINNEAYTDLRSIAIFFILIMSYILLTVIFLIIMVDKNFSNPITKLLKTVRKISDANNIDYDYTNELDLTRQDEIWFLAKSFDKMIKNIKSNIKILNEYKWLIDESSLVSKFDANWKITYVNDKFCQISVYISRQLIWKNISIIKHAEISNISYDDMWNSIKLKKTWKGTIKYLNKNWEAYWVSIVVSPIVDINNNIIEYISIWNDITELEKTKEELKSSYDKLQDSTTKLIEKERIGKEFELAEQIQNDFLPKINEVNINGIQVYFWIESATEIGWDLYDVLYHETDTNKVLFYVWDVTWHWLISWMIIAICNTLLYWLAKQYSDMLIILRNLNYTLFNKLPDKIFITMVMLQYNIEKWTFSYLWAWHERILIYKKKTDKVEEFKSWWVALGMLKTEKKDLKTCDLWVVSWDIILLYTDWITEARNKKWEFYWIDRFKESFRTNAHRKVDALYTSMQKDLNDYASWVEYVDDITMFIIKKD